MIVSHNNMLLLINRGIVPRKVEYTPPVPYAINESKYMGCPGKELFYSLPTYSPQEKKALIEPLIKVFPTTKGRTVQFSLFWRYFYGVFDKQGGLNTGLKVLEKWQKSPVDWQIYFDWTDQFMKKSLSMKRYIPYIIAGEMRAHRVGDLLLLHKDKQYMTKMLRYYDDVQKKSEQVGLAKNAFSAPYWASRYLLSAGEKELSFKYAIEFLRQANKHCQTSTIKVKISGIFSVFAQVLNEHNMKSFNRVCRGINNKVVRKFVDGALKGLQI